MAQFDEITHLRVRNGEDSIDTCTGCDWEGWDGASTFAEHVSPPATCGARIATAHPRISQDCALPVLHDGDHSPTTPPESTHP